MVKPTLSEVFGAGATQTATSITILKADLTGLNPSATNTAESLLAAINLKAQESLTQENFDTNTDQSIYIDSGFPSFTTRGTNNSQYRIDQLTINLAKIDSAATLDPDNY
jgi:hypothetical protein